MDHIYDVIILGAGPAGLSAGLYAGRSRLDTLIIEKGQAGGQIINTDEIENYPGQIVEGETGVSLVRRMYEQTEQFGAEHVRDTITNAELSGDIKVLTGEKDTYQAKNIIIATGAYARPIGCKGEQEYKGRGISYCATCDANFFTDLEVYVAGGGDAAVEDQPVVKALVDEGDEVANALRRDLGVKLGFDNAAVFHFNGNNRICH